MKASDIADKFGSIVNKQRTPIELALIVLILIHYAPTEVFGQNVNSRIRSMLGPVLTPIHAIMNNVFVEFSTNASRTLNYWKINLNLKRH